MQETLGVEGYRRAYLEKLEQGKAGEDMTIRVSPCPVTKDGSEFVGRDGAYRPVQGGRYSRVIPQKQEGLYALAYHPIGGVPQASKFAEIYETIQDMEEVELRLAPDETIYFINLNGREVEKALQVTADGAKNLFETSVACIGASICQVGLRDSQGALAQIIEEVRKQDFADGVLPRIHISGCTSSCGTHQIGTLGFHGGVKRVNNVVEPAFTFHVNGSDREGEERFGEQWGVMLQKDLPAFFTELGQAVQGEHTTFDSWFAQEPEKLRKIAEKYFV